MGEEYITWFSYNLRGKGNGFERQEFIRTDITKDTKSLRVTRDIAKEDMGLGWIIKGFV